MLVVGAGGMVGRAVCEYFESAGDIVFAYDHQSLDIADANQVKEQLQKDEPTTVINCAAWTDVDGCELDRERAFAANSRGPENLATASREVDALLLTISTDYVFDGEKQGFYTQRDQPNPQSVYGTSKLEGERRAQLANTRTMVVRTGFVFGRGGNNFLSTVVERARNGERLKAIADAYGTPTYAPSLALRLRELAQIDVPGVFHIVNSGEGVSFAEFARASLELGGYASTHVEGVEMKSLKRPAPRPRNSRLKCLLSEAFGLAPLPFWRDALKSFVTLDSPREIAVKQ